MLTIAALCLALNVYHEGRGESVEGQKAIAAVTMRRADNNKDKICDVVFQPKQFSWANPLTTVSPAIRAKRANKFVPTDEKSWRIAKKIATLALSGKLSTKADGAKFFYNPKIAKPEWRNKFAIVARIDDHIFMK